MAEKQYHKTIKKAISRLGKDCDNYKVREEGKIAITHPNKEKMFFYRPEIYFETTHGKIYIFEILDDEMKDPNLVIADIIQSYISPNVSKIFFIVKNKEEEDKVYKWASVIGARLEISGMDKIPEVTVYTISKTDTKSNKLHKILKKFARKDGWI